MNDLITAQGIVRERLSSLLTILPSRSENIAYIPLVHVYLDALNSLIARHSVEQPSEDEATALLNTTLSDLGTVQISDVVRTIDGAYHVLGIMAALPGETTSWPINIPPPPKPR